MKIRPGIRQRVTILFILIVSCMFFIAGILTYQLTKNERERRFRIRLENRLRSNARIFSETRNLNVLRKMDSLMVSSFQQKKVAILDSHFRYIYYYADKDADTLQLNSQVQAALRQNDNYQWADEDMIYYFQRAAHTGETFYLMVGAADQYGVYFLARLRSTLWIIFFVFILIILASAYFFTSIVIGPVEKIAGQIKNIDSAKMNQRISYPQTGDEIEELALSFNKLLDKLEETFMVQRRFIANASHELSNPLSVISSQLEVALQRKRTAENYEQVISSVKDDIIVINQLTRSLLDIARLGTDGTIELGEVRIDELLVKVTEDLCRQVPDYTVKLDFGDFPEEPRLLTVFGNHSLLHMAMRNLIENGCKYAADSTVRIATSFYPDVLTIQVSNKGSYIEPAEQELIFQPFYRSETHKTLKGSGLGLTLAKRILSLHKATIEVQSDKITGTVFSIKFQR